MPVKAPVLLTVPGRLPKGVAQNERLLQLWDVLRAMRWTDPLKGAFERMERFGIFGIDEASRILITNWKTDKQRLEHLLKQQRVRYRPLEVPEVFDSGRPERRRLLRKQMEPSCESNTQQPTASPSSESPETTIHQKGAGGTPCAPACTEPTTSQPTQKDAPPLEQNPT